MPGIDYPSMVSPCVGHDFMSNSTLNPGQSCVELDILIATHLKNQIHPFLCSALIMTQLESNQKLIVDFILIRQFFKII